MAFADHENPGGDDEGSVAVIASDGNGKEKKLSSGWETIEGVLWSPVGDEVWFTSSQQQQRYQPERGNAVGQDAYHHQRARRHVAGRPPQRDGADGHASGTNWHSWPGTRRKRGTRTGWFGWSLIRDISPDGHKIVFEEEGNGGGPNYTVFVRDTDGSPPARIGEGLAMAVSPDAKWVVTKPAKGGQLNLVPTGAGEARQLTHDTISYGGARWLPDGKRLLAAGIETGHGARDYLIDVSSGDSKPITPEGIAGTQLSPDGRSTAVLNADRQAGIWPLDGGGLRLIPGFDPNDYVTGWSPDGSSLYVTSNRASDRVAKVYKLNITTGKKEFWKTFGADAASGFGGVGGPHLSKDGTAYAYVYDRVLSEAYVVTGLK